MTPAVKRLIESRPYLKDIFTKHPLFNHYAEDAKDEAELVEHLVKGMRGVASMLDHQIVSNFKFQPFYKS